VVGTESHTGGAFVVAAGRDQHRGAHGLGDLDGRDAYAAGAALDQQGFTRLQVGTLKHIAPDREEGLGQRSRLDVAEALRHRQALPTGATHNSA
jgi:hypothetical protein